MLATMNEVEVVATSAQPFDENSEIAPHTP